MTATIHALSGTLQISLTYVRALTMPTAQHRPHEYKSLPNVKLNGLLSTRRLGYDEQNRIRGATVARLLIKFVCQTRFRHD